jgi:MEDS: MEthanogen/methylotroph, DcmR Sensory domain/Putative zinc-finger
MTVKGPLSCREFSALSGAFLDGGLRGADLERFESHREGCDGCRAGLAELQAIVRAARRLKAPRSVADAHALRLFREHGLHAARPRAVDQPLGIGTGVAARGDHIAFLFESGDEFATTADFLATGFTRGEAGVLVGPEAGNELVLDALRSRGVDASELIRSGRLVAESRFDSVEALLQSVDARIKAVVDRGLPGVRVLGNLTFGSRGSLSLEEILTVEALVTDAVRLYPNIVLCAFDAEDASSGDLHRGAFGCHPMIFRRGELRESDAYVPASKFLADLGRGA